MKSFETIIILLLAVFGITAAISLSFAYSCYKKYYFFLAKNFNDIWWKHISIDPVVQVWARKREVLATAQYGPISSFSLMKSVLDIKALQADKEVFYLKNKVRKLLKIFVISGALSFVLVLMLILFF